MDRLTSRRVCRCFIVLLAAALTAGASAAQVVGVVSGVPPAQTVQGQPRDRAPARRVGTAVIRGRVVDGVTGAPVARARVRVMNGPTSSSPVLTDDEGAFEFTKLPSGPTTLMAEKATYMPGRVPEMTATTVRARMQPLVLRDGQLLENVTISLFHGGAIAGRIIDAHGDPVENAQVRAARVVRSGRPQTMGQVQSNDLGEYRLPRLQPGRYIVQVRPQPSQGFQGAFMEGGPADVPLPQPIPTYYPGALAISQAQPLTVARGETLSGVDIMLVEGTPSLVTGTVVRADGGPVAGGSVTSRFVGSEMSGGFDFGGGTGIRQGGVFQITLPPGEYVLEANAQMTMPMGPVRPSQEDQIFGTARITVGGGAVEAVTIVVGRGATASGKVVFEGTTPAPAAPGPTNPPLFNPDGPGCRQGTVTIAADWTFNVEGLGGTCAASPQPMFGRWTVKSVVFRGQNIFDQQMTFESGQHYNDIQIVVTDKRTADRPAGCRRRRTADSRVRGHSVPGGQEQMGTAVEADANLYASHGDERHDGASDAARRYGKPARCGAGRCPAAVHRHPAGRVLPGGRRRHRRRGLAGSRRARTPRAERDAGRGHRRGPDRSAAPPRQPLGRHSLAVRLYAPRMRRVSTHAPR